MTEKLIPQDQVSIATPRCLDNKSRMQCAMKTLEYECAKNLKSMLYGGGNGGREAW